MPKAKTLELTLDSPSRRSICSPQLVEAIALGVERGLPVSRAAILAGVGKSTISEWIAEKPEIANRIACAEAKHLDGILQSIDAATDPKTNQKDWRAQAWLAEKRYKEDYGPRAETSVTVNNNTLNVTVSAAQQEALIERHRIALEAQSNA